MKLLILTVMSLFVLSPSALAMSQTEATALGDRVGKSICMAIWDGANSLYEVILRQKLTQQDRDNHHWVNRLAEINGKNDPIVKAFDKGFNRSIAPCSGKLKNLPAQ